MIPPPRYLATGRLIESTATSDRPCGPKRGGGIIRLPPYLPEADQVKEMKLSMHMRQGWSVAGGPNEVV